MTSEPTRKRPSLWRWSPHTLVISTLAVFVVAMLATPATRQAIALALLFALVPIGLAMLGLLLYLAMITSWANNK